MRFKGRGAKHLLFAAALIFLEIGRANADAPKPGEPTDENARKTFAGAIAFEKSRSYFAAISEFRKANKQDGGHCSECLLRAFNLTIKVAEFKDAEEIGREMIAQAGTPADQAAAHYRLAMAFQRQGVAKKDDRCYNESCDELKNTIALAPGFALAHYSYGVSLAHLHQDDAAKREFAAFVDGEHSNTDLRDRAQRYLDRIELARAAMAPPFTVTTLNGEQVSLDSLTGKVVLVDFWATWCGPCRQAIPHIRRIAEKFSGQPFTVLSINLDKDEDKWRSFVKSNDMTWPQARDGGLNGPVSRLFNVTAIPATFTIDADGELEDQHVGDADIEGKLKKLIARAVELKNRAPQPALTQASDAAPQ